LIGKRSEASTLFQIASLGVFAMAVVVEKFAGSHTLPPQVWCCHIYFSLKIWGISFEDQNWALMRFSAGV
jgi:hypothetical protein